MSEQQQTPRAPEGAIKGPDPIEELQRPPIDEMRSALGTLLAEEQFDQVGELLARLHPAETAALMTGLSGLERNIVFDLAPADEQHEVLIELEEADQEEVLERLSEGRIAEVLRDLDSDDATDVAALLDDNIRQRVLDATPVEDREEVIQLLGYEEDSAGGLMAVELVTVFDDQLVERAIRAVREAKQQGVEDIHYVYVVDRQQKLKGRISLIDVILADIKSPVSEIFDEEMVVVGEEQDQEEVARLFERYDLISAPVVDGEGRLVGRITVDDIVDVIHEEADEDIGFLSGTGEEEITERNPMVAARERLPWLVIAFIGELFGAVVVSTFEESLATVLIIAFFIPVVIAVAGNVGIQTSTIVVRGLATGEIAPGRLFSRVSREVLVSTISGVVLASILIVVILIWKDSLLIAMALSISLMAVVIIAAMVGSLVPFMLKALNQDPALASGPFITMTNDVLGLFVYLLITSSMLA